MIEILPHRGGISIKYNNSYMMWIREYDDDVGHHNALRNVSFNNGYSSGKVQINKLEDVIDEVDIND